MHILHGKAIPNKVWFFFLQYLHNQYLCCRIYPAMSNAKSTPKKDTPKATRIFIPLLNFLENVLQAIFNSTILLIISPACSKKYAESRPDVNRQFYFPLHSQKKIFNRQFYFPLHSQKNVSKLQKNFSHTASIFLSIPQKCNLRRELLKLKRLLFFSHTQNEYN